MRDRFHHIGSGYEHVRISTMNMKSVIAGEYTAPPAQVYNQRNLGHDARGHDIQLKNVGIPGEGRNTFLDSGATQC